MQNTIENNNGWLFEITPKNKLFSLNLKEVWRNRDFLMLFVKKNIITAYKQTVLGPLRYLTQPLFTSGIFTLIFNNVANIFFINKKVKEQKNRLKYQLPYS